MTTFTAYQLTSVINELLAEDGFEPVSSQQVYNATQKLRSRFDNDIPRAEAAEFVQNYVARRKTGKAVRKTATELIAELGL